MVLSALLPCAAHAGGDDADSTAASSPSGDEGGGSKARPAPQEVTVTDSRTEPARASGEPGVAAFTIRREALEVPGRQLGDALREAPGVQVSQLGGMGSFTTARLRGATSAQTPVYFGDVRLNDEVGGVADLGLIPPEFVERVEVYRSYAPRTAVEFGIGGAILLVPRRPKKGTALRFDFGSFGTEKLTLSSGFVGKMRETSALVSLDAAENNYAFHDSRGTLFDKSDDRISTLSNADTQGVGVWLSHTEKWKNADTQFFFGQSSREQGALKLALLPTTEARVAYGRTMGQVTSRFYGARSTVRVSTSAVRSESTVHDPLLELSPFSAELSTPGERLEQSVSSEHDVGRRWSLYERASVSLERFRRYQTVGGEFEQSLEAKRFAFRAAGGADYELTPHVTLTAVGEFRCVSTSPLSACAEPLPTARLGSHFHTGTFDLYASLANAVRLPTLSELYGFNPLMRGNERLLTEEAKSAEVGVRYAGGSVASVRGWVDGALFARGSENLILFVRSAQGYLTPQNRASARTLGAELALGVELGQTGSVVFQVSYLDARDTSPGRTLKNDVLPFISAITSSVVANVAVIHDPEGPLLLNLGVRASYQSQRFADPAGLGVIPAQSNVDLEADGHLLKGALIARASVRNIFDTSRYDVVGYPLPGRSAFLSLETHFK